MGDLLTWLQVHASLLGDAGLIALMLDRWAIRRENTDERHGERLDRIEAAIDKINQVASGRDSAIMARVLVIELDVRELKTLIRMRMNPRDDA